MYKCLGFISHLKNRRLDGKLISVLSFMLLFSFNVSKGYGMTEEQLKTQVRTTHATNIAAKEEINDEKKNIKNHRENLKKHKSFKNTARQRDETIKSYILHEMCRKCLIVASAVVSAFFTQTLYSYLFEK